MLLIFTEEHFYPRYVFLPDADDPIPSEIRDNPKFWPFFKDAIGALDGSHIHSSPPKLVRGRSRNRKGGVSQNCLFGCSFNLLFQYVLTGWEGSATDARVYEAGCARDLQIPANKYFLADAGFPASKGLLIPYRGVRYHLAESGRTNIRYKCFFTQICLSNLEQASKQRRIVQSTACLSSQCD